MSGAYLRLRTLPGEQMRISLFAWARTHAGDEEADVRTGTPEATFDHHRVQPRRSGEVCAGAQLPGEHAAHGVAMHVNQPDTKTATSPSNSGGS